MVTVSCLQSNYSCLIKVSTKFRGNFLNIWRFLKSVSTNIEHFQHWEGLFRIFFSRNFVDTFSALLLTEDFNFPGVFQTLLDSSSCQHAAGQVSSVILDSGRVDQAARGHTLVFLLLKNIFILENNISTDCSHKVLLLNLHLLCFCVDLMPILRYKEGERRTEASVLFLVSVESSS